MTDYRIKVTDKEQRENRKDYIQNLYKEALLSEQGFLKLYYEVCNMLGAYFSKEVRKNNKNANMWMDDAKQNLYEILLAFLKRYDPNRAPFIYFVFSIFQLVKNKYDNNVNEHFSSQRVKYQQKKDPNYKPIRKQEFQYDLEDEYKGIEFNENEYMKQVEHDATYRIIEEKLAKLNAKQHWVTVNHLGLYGKMPTPMHKLTDAYCKEFGAKTATAQTLDYHWREAKKKIGIKLQIYITKDVRTKRLTKKEKRDYDLRKTNETRKGK